MIERVFTPQDVQDVLVTQNLEGFTCILQGEQKRFAVAFTDNRERSVTLLVAQLNYYRDYESLGLGGRTSPKGEVLIDVVTTFDEFDEAFDVARQFRQFAIYDLVEDDEIVLFTV